MKTKSYIKAILSGFVWGLGQLFNKQFLKALFFFAIFALFIGIEFGTSNYFYKEDIPHQMAYEKIPGEDYGDIWFQNLATRYYNNVNAARPNDLKNIKNENFEKYLKDIGVQVTNDNKIVGSTLELFTEVEAIKFLAQEFRSTSPNSYTNLKTNDVILASEFNEENYKHLITKENIFLDETTNKFYYERSFEQEGITKREYIETNLFTKNDIENPEILSNKDTLVPFQKNNEHFKDELGNIYTTATIIRIVNDKEVKETIKIKLNHNNDYIIYEGAESALEKETIIGPIFANSTSFYEYYQPELLYNGRLIQYKDSTIMYTFKQAMVQTYTQIGGTTHDSKDFERLMLKVSFEMNPEIRDEFLKYYDNFFFDRAGMFLKGYWSVATLGVAKKQNYTSYLALTTAMIGARGTQNNLHEYISLVESIPIQGHVSTMLLIEGLIAVLLSIFFIIFMIWSIRDAYKVAEQKRKEEEVENDKQYFKSVWENGFEYIVLSPALFVLTFISIMPILFGFVIAFTSIAGNTSMVENFNYVGLKNFIAIFNFNSGLGASFGKAFWSVLSWTIIWAVFSTFTVFFGGFIQALILNSEKVVFRKFWRTILILPWAIPALLSQMVFSVMFNDTGFINKLLMDIGVYDILTKIGILGKPFSEMTGFLKHFWLGDANIQWFTNAHNVAFVKITLIVINIWLGFPYFMALMTGIMTAIDKNLYEAADIDGATGFQKIRQITIPLVLYSTAPILIMSFSGNFNNFGVIYFITGGGPNTGLASNGYAGATDILISWMYSLTVDYSIYNMASVFSVLVFLVVGSVTAWNLSRTRAFMED